MIGETDMPYLVAVVMKANELQVVVNELKSLMKDCGWCEMPFVMGKSKKAIGQNIATEIKAGKDKDQAIAIAYNVAKKGKKKRKKK